MVEINYGHQWTANSYNTYIVQSDLDYLWGMGVRSVRIPYPTYNSPAGTMNMCKNMVETALNKGFRVIWGVVGGRPTVTATSWGLFANYVLNSLIPYAVSLNNPNFQLSMGNEEDLTGRPDGVTITQAGVRENIKSLATSAKAAYSGTIDYVTDAEQRTAWSTGIGDLDKIGFNTYYEWNPASSFTTKVADMVTKFGESFYISEFSTDQGFDSATAINATDAEILWAENLKARADVLNSLGVTGYLFCYCDGAFNTGTDKWAVKKNDGTFRKAWYRLARTRAPVVRSYSNRTQVNRSFVSREYLV